MLAECVASVCAQTIQPLEHLIGIDYKRIGTTENTNRLAVAAEGEWLATLADDDLFFPRHLERLLKASEYADIVYSEPLVQGESWGQIGEKNAHTLVVGGPTPPSTALIRTSFWRRLGGYRGGRFASGTPEDMDFWLRAARYGARIVYVRDATWTYRFHGGNQSRR